MADEDNTGSQVGQNPTASGAAGTPEGSDNPNLDAPANSARANPPSIEDKPRIVLATDEVQKEVGENGQVFEKRSTFSAGLGSTEDATGAPDGFGAGEKGGTGQEPAVDTTAEAEEEEVEGQEDEDNGDGTKTKGRGKRKT